MELQERKEANVLRRFTDRLFGGLKMSWPVVIIYAVAAAVVTAVFLILPVFKNTSFQRMGETFEAWILFAVIIMANCKKPLESALKTFVFFLISQPLIYLLQVPFSWQGWGLFAYYRYWFIWTLCTLPMAFIGWYIKKKNWLSLLILTPVNLYLMGVSLTYFRFAFKHFPMMIVTALFCLLQVLLYLCAFVSDKWQKLAGLLVPAAAAVIVLHLAKVDVRADTFLPEGVVLSEQAELTAEEADGLTVELVSTGTDPKIRYTATGYGDISFTVRDGDKEYHFTLTVYEDDGGNIQSRITQE